MKKYCRSVEFRPAFISGFETNPLTDTVLDLEITVEGVGVNKLAGAGWSVDNKRRSGN